jgi:hypothetical protein
VNEVVERGKGVAVGQMGWGGGLSSGRLAGWLVVSFFVDTEAARPALCPAYLFRAADLYEERAIRTRSWPGSFTTWTTMESGCRMHSTIDTYRRICVVVPFLSTHSGRAVGGTALY